MKYLFNFKIFEGKESIKSLLDKDTPKEDIIKYIDVISNYMK